jgi:hypothetical protein
MLSVIEAVELALTFQSSQQWFCIVQERRDSRSVAICRVRIILTLAILVTNKQRRFKPAVEF